MGVSPACRCLRPTLTQQARENLTVLAAQLMQVWAHAELCNLVLAGFKLGFRLPPGWLWVFAAVRTVCMCSA